MTQEPVRIILVNMKKEKKYNMFQTDPVLDKCFYIIGWVFTGLAAAGYAGFRLGILDMFQKMSHCIFHGMTGYYCPGCGGTRAVAALLHGKILTSLYYHPVVVYTAVFAGWFMVSQPAERWSGGKLRIGMRYRDVYLWAALVLVLLNCLVKNLVLFFTGTALMA